MPIICARLSTHGDFEVDVRKSMEETAYVCERERERVKIRRASAFSLLGCNNEKTCEFANAIVRFSVENKMILLERKEEIPRLTKKI